MPVNRPPKRVVAGMSIRDAFTRGSVDDDPPRDQRRRERDQGNRSRKVAGSGAPGELAAEKDGETLVSPVRWVLVEVAHGGPHTAFLPSPHPQTPDTGALSHTARV